VTCGLYINCILYDYIRTIIALNRTNDPWILDPRARGPGVYSSQGTPIGVGNQVSCEFNLIYRWHAAISDRDDKWTQELTAKIFPGQDMGKISIDEFKLGLLRWLKGLEPDPAKRSVAGLSRNPDGTFNDDELVKIIIESTEDCAGILARERVADISCV
jgi:hypothetical protein